MSTKQPKGPHNTNHAACVSLFGFLLNKTCCIFSQVFSGGRSRHGWGMPVFGPGVAGPNGTLKKAHKTLWSSSPKSPEVPKTEGVPREFPSPSSRAVRWNPCCCRCAWRWRPGGTSRWSRPARGPRSRSRSTERTFQEGVESVESKRAPRLNKS